MHPTIEQYQNQFARFFGAERAFAFWKGRVALYALLRTLDVGQGDEVILPGYTCVMNVNPIKYVGAKPVYVDIEPATFNIDVNLLEEKITATTKIIIAQHTYGYPCDMDPILDIAQRHGVSVIEDCCLAFGSQYKGRIVGTLGRAGYFSFQWNKPYTTGLGGMVITSDKQLAGRIETLQADEMCSPSLREIFMLSAQLLIYRLLVYPRTTALAQSLFRYLTRKGAVVGSSDKSEFEPSKAKDFFKGAGAMQARSGLRQLRRIEQNISHRINMARLYDEILASIGYKSRDYDKTVITPVMVRYPVRITEKEKALGEAAKAGIELGSWFECPLHPIETPLASYDYTIGMCPEAEKAGREVVNLPLHPRADAGTVKKSADFITGFSHASS
ncbi:MAG: aminotransferase class I/II-fold pyridoxal phosphate-dependent enzyme [Phycisphaerales bacterium]|nr:MAG: aminotransferase class I/II-fold pyridoxal phosphate-dependent enzyme [Phycisphaerales bacterium]